MIIVRLVQYLPEHLHLVIATPVDPPLPLAQWRIRHWLSEFRAAELRFLSDEAQAFFALIKDQKLSSDAIERILARTQGWVAGLQLARLSLAEADNPDALARSFFQYVNRCGMISFCRQYSFWLNWLCCQCSICFW